MFIIYGRKDELEDDDWFGYMNCHNCGSDRKHIFKLLKRYPTLFFVKIPLGRVIKRYLVCTNCGANRVVKKKEYEYIKATYSALVQKDELINKEITTEKPLCCEQTNTTNSHETVQIVADKPIVAEKVLTEVESISEPSGKKKSYVNIKQKIIDNKSRVLVKKKEPKEEPSTVEVVLQSAAPEIVPAEIVIKSEKPAVVSEVKSETDIRELKIVGGKPQIAEKEYLEKTRERNTFIEIVAVVAVIVLFIFAVYEMSYRRRTTTTTTTTTTIAVNYTQTTEKHTTTLPFTKGVVVGNTYYNDWMNIVFELPENYTEVDEEFYRELEAATSDEYGMYFVSDKSESVAIGFADISSEPDITEEEFVELAAKEVEKSFSAYGDAIIGEVVEYHTADKKFKCICVYVYVNDRTVYLDIMAYKLDKRICYINIASSSLVENFDLFHSINKLY